MHAIGWTCWVVAKVYYFPRAVAAEPPSRAVPSFVPCLPFNLIPMVSHRQAGRLSTCSHQGDHTTRVEVLIAS